MLLLVLAAWLVTRNRIGPDLPRGGWQNVLEAIVLGIRGQIREIGGRDGADVFNASRSPALCSSLSPLSNVLEVVPGWHPPTGSLSTTAALAICVAVSRPDIRHPAVGSERLPAPLLESEPVHGAFPPDERVFANRRAGRPAVREYHERVDPGSALCWPSRRFSFQ